MLGVQGLNVRRQADTKQTQSRHKADTKQTQSSHKADTKHLWTKFEGNAFCHEISLLSRFDKRCTPGHFVQKFVPLLLWCVCVCARTVGLNGDNKGRVVKVALKIRL